jgi:hypothetical protein
VIGDNNRALDWLEKAYSERDGTPRAGENADHVRGKLLLSADHVGDADFLIGVGRERADGLAPINSRAWAVCSGGTL